MKSLILVDLDNVYKWLTDVLATTHLQDLTPERAEQAVVVMGLNCDTARRLNKQGFSTWDLLERLAREVVKFVENGAQLASVEIALTLTAPEAVDSALLSLLHKAPEPDGSGEFERVWVLSNDKGLRRSVQDQLGAIKTTYHPQTQGDPSTIASRIQDQVRDFQKFVWGVAAKRFIRSEEKRDLATGKPVEPHPAPSVFIEKDELAAWASKQNLQVEGTLNKIAKAVNREPSLLTQIGVTRYRGNTVTVGVSRLKRALQGRAGTRLGPCGRQDGLEISMLKEFRKKKLHATRLEPSPAGPGSVRLLGEIGGQPSGLTVRTRLPFFLVAKRILSSKTKLKVPISKFASIDDQAWLRHVVKTVGIVREVKRTATFSRFRSYANCKLASEGEQVWWCHIEKDSSFIKATSAHKIDEALRDLFPMGQISVTCSPWGLRLLSGPALVMASPIDKGQEVKVSKGSNTKSRVLEAKAVVDGHSIPCALLLKGGFKAGDVLPAMPVQLADVYRLASWLDISEAAADSLRTLPLVIPVESCGGFHG